MTKLNAFLATLLVLCSLSLVTSQHRARRAFVEYEHAQRLTRQLDVAWDQLQLDQSRLAKPGLIDGSARRDLKMEQVSPPKSLYLAMPQFPGDHEREVARLERQRNAPTAVATRAAGGAR